jgi:hypothetical protein
MKFMGKIMAVVVVLMMLVGCSTASQSEYLGNMREVNILMNGTIGEITDALKLDSYTVTYNRMVDIHRQLELIEGKANEKKPPKKLAEPHEHYLKFVKAIKDSVSAMLKEDKKKHDESIVIAEKEATLAKPLVDMLKEE